MLKFNELRLTPDNKCLIIDVSVENLPYFENVTIDSIFIDTLDTWVPNGYSSKAIPVYSEDNKGLDIIQDETGKHVRLEILKPIIDTLKRQMYFIYAIADTSNAPESTSAPCECNNETILGTVINTYYLYNTLLSSIKDIADNCSNNKNFINDFLRVLSIDASIKAGNYPLAIKYWNLFFNKETKETIYKPCGCNGKH